MVCAVSATAMLFFHSFRSSSVYFVYLPFTFHACGLFASNRCSRDKTPVCVSTMLVRVITPFTLPQDFLPECFRVIAANSLCRSSCDGMGSVSDFGPVCYTRVDESSKTICGAAAEEP